MEVNAHGDLTCRRDVHAKALHPIQGFKTLRITEFMGDSSLIPTKGASMLKLAARLATHSIGHAERRGRVWIDSTAFTKPNAKSCGTAPLYRKERARCAALQSKENMRMNTTTNIKGTRN